MSTPTLLKEQPHQSAFTKTTKAFLFETNHCSEENSMYRCKAGPDGTIACRALRVGEVDDREQAKPLIIKSHLLSPTAAYIMMRHY